MESSTSPTPPALPRRALFSTAAAVAGGAVASQLLGASSAAANSADATLRGPKLSPGDTIRLISPAGPANQELVEVGIELLESWGLNVQLADHALDEYGYLAAPDHKRLADINAAIADKHVKAIMTTRGGYGTTRIIDDVDFSPLLKHPKLILGYSDISALHLAAYQHTGIATLHSPMAGWGSNNTKETEESLRNALMEGAPTVLHRDRKEDTASIEVPGKAEGPVFGGNLSLLAAEPINGNLPDLTGAIVFMEDVGEPPYSIDRMLTTLLRAGVLDQVSGFAIGQFTNSEGSEGTWTMQEAMMDRLAPLGVPVLGGLKVGHGADPRVLPLGTKAKLNTYRGTLEIEPAVS